MRYWFFLICLFFWGHVSKAQNPSAFPLITDDYSTYIVPSVPTGLSLLEANTEVFKSWMKQYHYQPSQRGFDLEYLAPTTRTNHMRLIRKENQQVLFGLTPVKMELIKQIEQTLLQLNPTITQDQAGTTWYHISHTKDNQIFTYQVGIKIESDTEDRVGRTWSIWSANIIFRQWKQ